MAQSKQKKKQIARQRAKARVKAQSKEPATRVKMEDTISQLQTALINMRGMYDTAMQEKAVLEGAINQRDQLITALAVEYSGVSLKEATVKEVTNGDYVGYEQEMEAGELFIFAIHKDDLEEEVEDEDAEGSTEEVAEEDAG